MVIKLTLTLDEAGQQPRVVVSDLDVGDSLTVGRGNHVQLWVNDQNISREHCRVLNENGVLYVEDSGSRNGTYLNGQRIIKKAQGHDGDTIRLASTSSIRLSLKQPDSSPKQAIWSPPATPEGSRVDDSTHIGVGLKLTTPKEAPWFPAPLPEEKPQPTVSQNKPAVTPKPLTKEFSLLGETFNGYRVEEQIGVGGMSVVYRGTHLAMHRTVAIKTLAQRLITNPKAVTRFLNVAKVAGKLYHPNIGQVYDSGSLDQYGIYYIVMEYVDGTSLHDILKEEGRLSLSRACTIISHIASALSFAKKRNIIHRDVNPSNIMVDKENVAKLIGLGLAKSLDDEMTALTQAGKGMGMMGYIPPEQLLDATQADHRSDVYSLAAVYYQCLTGQTPYDAKNMREYFNCIHQKIPPIPVHELNAEVPSNISNIIGKALGFEPADRYQSADEFLLDLKEYLNPHAEDEGIAKACKQIMAMLPKRTSVPGLEFESIFRPYGAIGGDFYDFIERNEDELGIVIGDVTGHGVEAAVVVGMVKSTIKIFGKQTASTAEALRLANQEIYPDLDPTTFVTIFYGIINKKTHQLRFSRAGHNPLILFNPQRNPPVSTYEPKGMVMGMFSRFICEEATLDLQPGDILLQYTDGITEAKNAPQEEYGIERLCETTQNSNTGDIKELLNLILQDLVKFTGAEEQQDDITIIAIKIL